MMIPFIEKPLKDVTLVEVQGLVDRSVGESLHLDYKAAFALTTREDQKEFLKDVSAFANSQGGLLIYGIEEEKDAQGKNTGLPKRILGVPVPNADQLTQQIENYLRDGIEERLPRYELNFIPVGTTGSLILIRVPWSMRSPHMVKLGADRLFKRIIGGCQNMSVGQIRDSVLQTQSITEGVEAFIKSRVDKLRARSGDTFLTVHVVPLQRERSILPMHGFTFEQLALNIGGNGLPQGLGLNIRYTLEGYKVSQDLSDRQPHHCLIFRDGSCEYRDTTAFSEPNDTRGKSFYRQSFEQQLFRQVTAALNLYSGGYAQLPAIVAVTLIRANDFVLYGSYRPYKVEEDICRIDPVLITELTPDVKPLLRPVCDMVSNVFGLSRAESYKLDGIYVGYAR